MSRLRLAVALALAAAGLWPSVQVLLGHGIAAPRRLDAAQEADLRYGQVRPWVPPRVGFCADVDLDVAELISPGDRLDWRIAQRFLAQYALAPTIVVAVLGQPSNGQRDPSEADREARLAELDVVLEAARPGSRCWDGAIELGFRPVAGAASVVVFRRGPQ